MENDNKVPTAWDKAIAANKKLNDSFDDIFAEEKAMPEVQLCAEDFQFGEPEMQNPQIGFDEAMQAIIDNQNENVDQVNALITDLENMTLENSNLSIAAAAAPVLLEKNTTLEQQLVKANGEADIFIREVANLKQQLATGAKAVKEALNAEVSYNIVKEHVASMDDELVSLQLTKKKMEHALKISDKNVKALKANNAKHKASNDVLRKRVTNLQSENKNHCDNIQKSKMEVQADWITIYSNSNLESLILHPQRHDVHSKEEHPDGSVVLLYTNNTGTYLTCAYSTQYGAAFSSFLNRDNNLADRTKNILMKNSIKPSIQIIEFAKKWLKKVNIDQQAVPNSIDVSGVYETL